jgi:hypothetical protein
MPRFNRFREIDQKADTDRAALISTDVMLGIYRRECQKAITIGELQGLRRIPPDMRAAFLMAF